MFGFPTKKELTKPDFMSEQCWALLFDAHMKRHDSFSSGFQLGFFCGIIFLILVALF